MRLLPEQVIPRVVKFSFPERRKIYTYILKSLDMDESRLNFLSEWLSDHKLYDIDEKDYVKFPFPFQRKSDPISLHIRQVKQILGQ